MRWWIYRALAVILWGVGFLTIGRVGVLYAAMFTMGQGVVPVAWGRENLLLSLWYTLPTLGILAAHEGGHWWMARRYGLRTTGPFLLPWPSSWAAAMPWAWLPTLGVLGAVLRLRDPFPGRLAQWDVVFTGLAAGVAATLLCTVLGALWSLPLADPHIFSRLWTPRIMRVLTGPNVTWHPIMMAARVGWCVTLVSLIPLVPCDGGRLFWIIPSIWKARRVQVWCLGVICLLCWVS